MQSKEELEDWYNNQDPWGYEQNPDDISRKQRILGLLDKKYKKALDIGAGEGFITRDLPAETIHAIEISDIAAKRLPEGILRVLEPIGEYDLIIATGILYPQYNWRQVLDWIKEHATGTILLSNIKDWEVREVAELGEPVYTEEYKYRQYTQKLRIYEASPQHRDN